MVTLTAKSNVKGSISYLLARAETGETISFGTHAFDEWWVGPYGFALKDKGDSPNDDVLQHLSWDGEKTPYGAAYPPESFLGVGSSGMLFFEGDGGPIKVVDATGQVCSVFAFNRPIVHEDVVPSWNGLFAQSIVDGEFFFVGFDGRWQSFGRYPELFPHLKRLAPLGIVCRDKRIDNAFTVVLPHECPRTLQLSRPFQNWSAGPAGLFIYRDRADGGFFEVRADGTERLVRAYVGEPPSEMEVIEGGIVASFRDQLNLIVVKSEW